MKCILIPVFCGLLKIWLLGWLSCVNHVSPVSLGGLVLQQPRPSKKSATCWNPWSKMCKMVPLVTKCCFDTIFATEALDCHLTVLFEREVFQIWHDWLEKKTKATANRFKNICHWSNKKCNFQAQKPICTTSQLRSCWSSASSTGSFQNNLWDRKGWDSVWTRVQILSDALTKWLCTRDDTDHPKSLMIAKVISNGRIRFGWVNKSPRDGCKNMQVFWEALAPFEFPCIKQPFTTKTILLP